PATIDLSETGLTQEIDIPSRRHRDEHPLECQALPIDSVLRISVRGLQRVVAIDEEPVEPRRLTQHLLDQDERATRDGVIVHVLDDTLAMLDRHELKREHAERK